MEAKGKTKKIFEWVADKVKSTDRFATSISLNFQGDTSFKTGIGGLATVLSLWFLLAYFGLLLSEMINRDNSVINSITKMDNLIYNPTRYNLADYNFLIGIIFSGASANQIFDPTYFDFQIYQVTQTKSTFGTGMPKTINTSLNYDKWGTKYYSIFGLNYTTRKNKMNYIFYFPIVKLNKTLLNKRS